MFRYRLHSPDGDDLGEATYAMMIKPHLAAGKRFRARSGSAMTRRCPMSHPRPRSTGALLRVGRHEDVQNAFCMHDSRAGGFERFVGVGDVLPSGDAAVTAAPLNFSSLELSAGCP